VRLRASAAGVSASVVAQAPEAAALLQQAADDLRRSLEAGGLTLLRLDVAVAGDPRAGSGEGGEPGYDGRRGSGGDAAADAGSEEPATRTIELPSGVLVDVLA
jgi:flagellar hook-length control protein FliK